MIRDTVSLLCRNSLSHGVGVRIQGLIGITVDDSDVLLVHFDESYDKEHDRHQNIDDRSSTSAAVVEPPKSNPRKRPRLSETMTAEQSAVGEAECDVIFIADDVNDNDVKFGIDQLCSSVDNNCNSDQTGIGQVFQTEDAFVNQTGISQMFKAEDAYVATNLNLGVINGDNQSSYVKRCSRGNVLLRNMLADENGYLSEQALSNNYLSDLASGNTYLSDDAADWKSESVSCEQTTVQTASMRREQMTARPRIKQVVIKFSNSLYICTCVSANRWADIHTY